MNIEDLDKQNQEKYGRFKLKVIGFEIIAMLIIVPCLWIFPQYVEIKHAIGVTVMNIILYIIATLKEKNII